jgi:hypothetical protein
MFKPLLRTTSNAVLLDIALGFVPKLNVNRGAGCVKRTRPVLTGAQAGHSPRLFNEEFSLLRFSGVELCERLAALVPHPRLNLIRFGGVFAPRHRLRPLVVAMAPKGAIPDSGIRSTDPAVASEEGKLQPKKYSLSWNELRARVFKEDLSHCRKCGGDVKITDAILDRDAIKRILTALGLPTVLPKFAPPSRAPPGGDFDQDEFSWA